MIKVHFRIITCFNNNESVDLALRCLNKLNDIHKNYKKIHYSQNLKIESIDIWEAYTPSTYKEYLDRFNLGVTENFRKDGRKYSKIDNAIAAFASHYSLWDHALTLSDDEVFCILEHDAFPNEMLTSRPDYLDYFMFHLNNCLEQYKELSTLSAPHIINVGAPSYGKYESKIIPFNSFKDYYGKLISKEYFPGAHAYILGSGGAFQLIKKAKDDPQCIAPTDLYLSHENFPNMLYEYYQHLFVANDSFSTIQKLRGCAQKHNYDTNNYRLVDVE